MNSILILLLAIAVLGQQQLGNGTTSLNVSEDIGNFTYGFFKEVFVQMNEYNASVCVTIIPLLVDGIDQIIRITKNTYNVRAYLKLTLDLLLAIERGVLDCGTLIPAFKRIYNYTLSDFTEAYWTYLNLNILKVLAKMAPLIKNIRDSILSKNYLKMGVAFGDVYYLIFINIRPPVKYIEGIEIFKEIIYSLLY